jgi:hypothetical protein
VPFGVAAEPQYRRHLRRGVGRDTCLMSIPPQQPVRPTGLLATISLATDLGTGQPMEHALRTCHIAMGLARSMGLSGQDLSDTYYLSLLRFLGCTHCVEGR